MAKANRSIVQWLTSVAVGALVLSGARDAWAVDCSAPTAGCKSAVTVYDPYCSNTAWDSICQSECGTDATCQAEVNCAAPDAACKNAVGAYDSYCTSTGWDSLCQTECSSDKTCAGTANDLCAGATDVTAGGTFSGSTAGYNGDYTGSCAGSTAPESVYRLKFATSKVVTLSTAGSAFDTVLYVQQGTSDAACGGAEQACNDDANGTLQSQVTFTASANQMYFVFVDGFGATASGATKLTVTTADPSPPSNDTYAGATLVPAATAVASTSSGTTADATNDYSASCGGGAAGKDRVHKLTLGSTQTITFDTIGSGYDTVLHLRDASYNELGCDDDSGGSLTSRITKTLAAGTYYVVVDGYSAGAGAYNLHVAAAVTPPAVLFVNGHGNHLSDYVSYWGGTGGNALPVYAQARTSKAVTTHGYNQTLHLSVDALNLANDINATYPNLANGTLTTVTHSAGGLVVRYLLSHADDGPTGPRTLAAAKIGKVITIAAPHRGTVLANLVEAGSITQWIGGLAGFNTDLVWDMQTGLLDTGNNTHTDSFGNCYGTTGVCGKIFTIGADGQSGGWLNDISKFLGIPVPGTGHAQDWGLAATGAIGRAMNSDFDDSDGFIAWSSACGVGTQLGRSNANHFHNSECDYRTDVCNWVAGNL